MRHIHVPHDERGLTLIEVLAALTIFFAILLPLTSVYTKGVSLYATTRTQTDLRNEADFVLGDIMRTLREHKESATEPNKSDSISPVSSFELKNYPSDSEDTLKRIFSNRLAGGMMDETARNAAQNAALVYYRSVKLVSRDPNNQDEEKITQSSVSRVGYVLSETLPAGTNGLYQRFPIQDNRYLIDGLFEMTTDGSQKLIVYLLIAPRGEQITTSDGETTQFRNVEDVEAELNRLENAHETKLPGYIHLVRTEFAVNDLIRG
ncbi:PilW family protein [Aneurinibacillus uraniidurans]|uniref:PilW family protein n=1 Tax=Aneurinibacillus uraniidurans TaxID=2966586 RepID=UPI002349EC64|nr:prepilin-type N-terminal cleavage/methylation domain-containing protein [Aneurinibacillus sp. B1]WCN38544.1 prepilin-type N-terminal cleavage/methylation domain-containing protein [Aneurinibacillus sp. B1]